MKKINLKLIALLPIIIISTISLTITENSQSFNNYTGIDLLITITYHTDLCPNKDNVIIKNGTHITIPSDNCQPQKIEVFDAASKDLIGEKTLLIGSDGAEKGSWDLIKGAKGDGVIIRDNDIKNDLYYYQWVDNRLPFPITVILDYIACKNDILPIQAGGSGIGEPGACLLREIRVVKKGDIHHPPLANHRIKAFSREQSKGHWIIEQNANGQIIITSKKY